jgi:hypothetical protein
MEPLKQTKKITLATLKSFAKRNKDRLFVKNLSDFNGMSDCVEQNESPSWSKTKILENTNFYKTGIDGVYTVGNSRDYFQIYEDKTYLGIKVYNCCGSCILAVKKDG